jgi:hypothetical protein
MLDKIFGTDKNVGVKLQRQLYASEGKEYKSLLRRNLKRTLNSLLINAAYSADLDIAQMEKNGEHITKELEAAAFYNRFMWTLGATKYLSPPEKNTLFRFLSVRDVQKSVKYLKSQARCINSTYNKVFGYSSSVGTNLLLTVPELIGLSTSALINTSDKINKIAFKKMENVDYLGAYLPANKTLIVRGETGSNFGFRREEGSRAFAYKLIDLNKPRRFTSIVFKNIIRGAKEFIFSFAAYAGLIASAGYIGNLAYPSMIKAGLASSQGSVGMSIAVANHYFAPIYIAAILSGITYYTSKSIFNEYLTQKRKFDGSTHS